MRNFSRLRVDSVDPAVSWLMLPEIPGRTCRGWGAKSPRRAGCACRIGQTRRDKSKTYVSDPPWHGPRKTGTSTPTVSRMRLHSLFYGSTLVRLAGLALCLAGLGAA